MYCIIYRILYGIVLYYRPLKILDSDWSSAHLGAPCRSLFADLSLRSMYVSSLQGALPAEATTAHYTVVPEYVLATELLLNVLLDPVGWFNYV